jgi:hypothetical protein
VTPHEDHKNQPFSERLTVFRGEIAVGDRSAERDYLVHHVIKVVCEDMWGAEIVSAAVSHFAASTPAELLFNTTDLHT